MTSRLPLLRGTVRRSLRRVTRRGDAGSDGGFTMAEVLVAMFLITGAVTAMLGMITRSVQTHRAQRDSAAAERAATQTIEGERDLTFDTLSQALGTSTSSQAFTPTTTVSRCSVTDPAGSCSSPSPGAPADLHVHVQVHWSEAGQAKHLDLTTGVTDPRQTLVSGAGSSTLATLTGAATGGLTVSATGVSASPHAATVTPDGHPGQAVTLTATVLGLPATATFPLTWSDDTGSHQVTMTNTGGLTTWTAVVPAASVTRVLGAGQHATVTFAATVPGSPAVPTATLTLTPVAAPTATCTAPVAITMVPLTTKTLLPVTLTCTTTSLTATDTVGVSWPLAAGSATGRLASTDGNSWSLTLPAGTSLRSGLSEIFTFTATRSSDGATAGSTAASTLA